MFWFPISLFYPYIQGYFAVNNHANIPVLVKKSSSIWVNEPHNLINSSHPGQNGRHCAYDIFKCIFINEKFYISIRISLKFVPKGPVDKKIKIGSVNGLAPNRRQAITWTNADPAHRRIYTALGGDELRTADRMTTTKQSKTKLYAYLWDILLLFYGIYYVLWGIKITSTEANRISYSWDFQIRDAHVFRKKPVSARLVCCHGDHVWFRRRNVVPDAFKRIYHNEKRIGSRDGTGCMAAIVARLLDCFTVSGRWQ